MAVASEGSCSLCNRELTPHAGRGRGERKSGAYMNPLGYATRAREDVDPRELIEVGSVESRTGRLEITATANELSWWIAPADLADLGFSLEAR